MTAWRDVVDWAGGWPYEVARPDEIVAFYGERELEVRKLNLLRKGHGCNEYVFAREGRPKPDPVARTSPVR
jgi:2-polyprenyl-6-hydroxyphenyl methylase/3-demethylubiquinone-9 3-methyltransferase